METPDEFARLGIALAAVADGIDTTEAATRDNMRTLVAALLRAERHDRERAVLGGLGRRTHTGTRSGRPLGRLRLEIDRDRLRVLRDQGRSCNQIAKQMGASVSLVRRELARSTLEAHFDDILTECPSVSLKAAARWIVRNYGYDAGAVADFLRGYPWARKLFRERKRSHREGQKRRAAFRARAADAEVKKGA